MLQIAHIATCVCCQVAKLQRCKDANFKLGYACMHTWTYPWTNRILELLFRLKKVLIKPFRQQRAAEKYNIQMQGKRKDSNHTEPFDIPNYLRKAYERDISD